MRLATRQECVALLLRLAAAIVTGYLLLAQVFLVAQVSGMGMFPSMKDGDLVIAFRLQQIYTKDDVVAYRAEGALRFGRVAARGGDVVTLGESGALVVNGAVQGGDILYPTYAVGGLEYPYRVPDVHVFVLGDFRTQTQDSREFGPVPLPDVAGKVITILRRRGL